MITTDKQYTIKNGDEVKIYAVHEKGTTPVHGAVLKDGIWRMQTWTMDGVWGMSSSDQDLVPQKTKHEGWVNIYKGYSSYFIGTIHDSESKAIEAGDTIFGTIKIEWEEG